MGAMKNAVSKKQDGGERIEVAPIVTVGFAFMTKKLDSMTKVQKNFCRLTLEKYCFCRNKFGGKTAVLGLGAGGSMPALEVSWAI